MSRINELNIGIKGAPSQPFLPGFSLKGQSLNIVPDLNKREAALAIHTSDDLPSLYHGSPSYIKPGQELKLGGQYSKQWNYATSNPTVASGYARGRDKLNGDEGQGTLFSVIHKVEPVKGEEVYKDASENGDRTAAFVSKKFKVVGATHLIDNQTGQATPVGLNKKAGLDDDRRSKPWGYQEELPGMERIPNKEGHIII